MPTGSRAAPTATKGFWAGRIVSGLAVLFLLFDSLIKVMLTGYLGGAVATHVRVGSPLLSHTLFPIYVALLIWGGLVLRDHRLRTVL
jgi:hypothetical protein